MIVLVAEDAESEIIMIRDIDVLVVRGLPIFLGPPYAFQLPPILFRSFPTSCDHPAPRTIISTCDISSQLIACGRTASPGLVTVARGLVLYMDTSIYMFHADQGSLESISKDFPCVRYVVL